MSEPTPQPHDPAALKARRAAARRAVQRRRRQVGGLAGAAAATVAVSAVIIGTAHGSKSPKDPTTRAPEVKAPADVRRGQSAAEKARVQAAIKHTIAANDYIARGTPKRKVVALTFDDGPGPATPKLLATLKRLHVPATFFVVGKQVKLHPELVRQEVAEGHVVADHTVDHANLKGQTLEFQQNEILQDRDLIQGAVPGTRVQLFRPPYGAFDDTTLQILSDAGLVMVLWSVDTKDFSRPGTDKIVYTALSGARAGSIVLMHDAGGIRNQTVAAVPRIVKGLRKKGYELVTVPDLLTQDPVPADQPKPTSLAGS